MKTRVLTLCLFIGMLAKTSLAVSEIYIYPNKGQTTQQQSRDRYECHVWAAQQSGFDPTSFYTTTPAPLHVASASGVHYPHSHRHGDLDPITGAAGGAALGALGGAIGGDAGKGAAIGAGVGALAGIFNSAGKHQRHKSRHAAARANQARQQAQLAEDQENYRRALSACLTAHDYTVR